MHLTQIDILKYKSIKQSDSVYFNEGKVVTLIGKNGSGKTNVLEVIKYAFSKNQFYGRDKIECKIIYYIELTDEEMEEYFSCVVSERRDKVIKVKFDGANPEIRQIEAPILEVSADNFRERLNNILYRYKEATKKYLKALKELESSDCFANYLNLQVIEGNRGNLSYITSYQIEQLERDIDSQVKEIKDYINAVFKDGKISLNRHELYYPQSFWFRRISFYKIPENEQIKISPIVAKSLNLTKKKLEIANQKLNNEIHKINQILANEFDAINAQVEEFEKIKNEIADVFEAKRDEQSLLEEQFDKKFASVFEQLRNTVFRNCYFIDNENSLLFANSAERQYQYNQKIQENLNSNNPIIEAFDRFLKDRSLLKDNESISQMGKLEEIKIKKAVQLLNAEFLLNLKPKFDNNEILKFEVRNENGTLNLYVHEKDEDIVSFNDTSLGRRWYLTYQFVKALLKPGDMLLIDEPAAFLHPQAQTEFKEELERLSHEGIGVFYSTHSPYMIPEDWGQVYNVAMTDNGTQLTKFESGDDLCETIKNELGAKVTSEILFNLSKTIILVEGIADKNCIEKFAELLQYNLNDYHIHVCDGEAILQVAYICLKNKIIKTKVVLDNDNKYKSEYFKKGHSMYSECISLLNANSDCCVYIGDGETGCLEDLFVEKENAKYKHYKNQRGQWKVDVNAVKKLKTIEDVSAQTKSNFERLFKQLGIPKLDETKN